MIGYYVKSDPNKVGNDIDLVRYDNDLGKMEYYDFKDQQWYIGTVISIFSGGPTLSETSEKMANQLIEERKMIDHE